MAISVQPQLSVKDVSKSERTADSKRQSDPKVSRESDRRPDAPNTDAVVLDVSLGTKIAAQESEPQTLQDRYNALSLTSKEIVDKINERLKISLPNGVQSLKPEEVTPEATAERIVSGVTAMFEIFAKQRPGVEGDELVDSFLSVVRGGVQEGYDDAVKILEAVGAFTVSGVKEGIEKTKLLIEQKLIAFGAQKKEALNPKETAEKAPQDREPERNPVGGTTDSVA